jgi:phosphatidylglycerophosphatase A
VAPGTFGAAGGVAVHLGLAMAGAGPLAFGAICGALLALGARASSVAEVHFDQHDDGRIVIDEVVGQLIALAPIVVLAPARVLDPLPLLLGFLSFRLFDIWKPGPVKAAERGFEAGWGVMLDDVVAGLLAAAVVAAALLTGALP